MSAELLRVENLAVTFESSSGPVPAVVDMGFSLLEGECTALVGESGSGKSVTAAAILGLVPKPGRVTGGRILFGGDDVGLMDEARLRDMRGRRAGMVFQEPMTSLNPVYTVGFHLKEALTSHCKMAAGRVRERSIELLSSVGIPDPEARLGVYPHQLSGGLRQRVMIACALALGPKLLIADEPTTALDVTVEAQIMRLLDDLRETCGTAVLLVTHDLGLVAQHSQKVVVAYAGYVVEIAPVIGLFDSPFHPYTRALLESMPGGLGNERLKPIPGNVPRPGKAPSGCAFRDRCPLATGICSQAVPELRRISADRFVRCVRFNENA